MTTFWCLNKACRKPIEVRRTIPEFCPHCQEPFAGTTTVPLDPPPVPPPLETTLSDTDRAFLKVQRIKVEG